MHCVSKKAYSFDNSRSFHGFLTRVSNYLSSIHRGHPETGAERMRKYRARKKKETPIKNNLERYKSGVERAQEYRDRRKAKIQSAVSIAEAMKIGFIGGGKLAFALANGFISAGLAKPDEITASCHPADTISAEAFKSLGAMAITENRPVVERSEVVIISVKPDVVVPVLKEVKDLSATKNKLFISVAMGISTATIEKVLPSEARVIRVMPNTPALIKEGAAALSRGSKATPDDAKIATKLFRAVGTCDEVPEYQMDAVTALSGSGPAYIYMLIESLADGGVRCGLPRDLALRLATQTTRGAAGMVREAGHPAALRDNVTSPAGSTAEGTYHLEKNGFRSAVIGAVMAASDRCKIVNEQLNK